MIRLIIFFCCLSFLGFSQEPVIKRFEETIIPNLHNDIYTVDANDYSKVKSIMTIRKTTRNDGFRVDTLWTNYYENGLKFKTIHLFQKTLPITEARFTYNKGRKLIHWFQEDFSYDWLNFYEYDTKQRIIKIDKNIIHRKWKTRDTTTFKSESYVYTNDKLSAIHHSAHGNALYSDKYEYKDNLLDKNTNNAFLYTYIYDERNNLIKVIADYPVIDTIYRMNVRTFEYNKKNQLIKDFSNIDNKRLTNILQSTTYSYDINNQLKEMNITYDTLYRNLTYEYEKSKIKTIVVKTNGDNVNLKNWMPHHLKGYYPFPITYHEVFEYDDFGNKTAKRIYVGEELYYEELFLIQYHK